MAGLSLAGALLLFVATPVPARAPRWGGLEAVAVSPDGKSLAVGGQNRTLYLLDASTLEVRRRVWVGGRIVFLAPRGLRDASLYTVPFDDAIAYKTRLQPNGPLRFWGGSQLGMLDEDRQITVVTYRAPAVIVTVKNEDGRVPDDLHGHRQSGDRPAVRARLRPDVRPLRA